MFTGGGAVMPSWPQHFAAGDVFAMPCRTRRFGMDVEGLGHRVPGGVGDRAASGGRGFRGRPGRRAGRQDRRVVDGIGPVPPSLPHAVGLLADRALARSALGAAGRQWVQQGWQWDGIAGRLGRSCCSSTERAPRWPRPAGQSCFAAEYSAAISVGALGHHDVALELERRA